MFRSILYSKLKEKKISTKKAVFVLNSARIASRDIELPLVKEKQLKEMIAMNASDRFPLGFEPVQAGSSDYKKITRKKRNSASFRLLLCLMILFCDYGSGMMHGYMPFNAAGELRCFHYLEKYTDIRSLQEADPGI